MSEETIELPIDEAVEELVVEMLEVGAEETEVLTEEPHIFVEVTPSEAEILTELVNNEAEAPTESVNSEPEPQTEVEFSTESLDNEVEPPTESVNNEVVLSAESVNNDVEPLETVNNEPESQTEVEPLTESVNIEPEPPTELEPPIESVHNETEPLTEPELPTESVNNEPETPTESVNNELETPTESVNNEAETPTDSVNNEPETQTEMTETEPEPSTTPVNNETDTSHDTSTETKESLEEDLNEQQQKANRELKMLLAMSKEAKIDINISHKRKSTENSKYKDQFVTKLAKSSNIRYPVTAETELENSTSEESPVSKKYTPSKISKRKKESVSESESGSTTDEVIKKPRRGSQTIIFKPNKDSFCWRCHRDGVDIACEICPRSYHQKCLKQSIGDPDHWPCPECVAIQKAENVQTRSESMKGMTLGHFCSLLQHAVKRMLQCSGAEPFQHPVNETDFPDYKKYIIKPMDLTQLQKNINENLYASTQAFEAEAKWILHNSIIFNSYQSKLTATARAIIKICKQEMAEIENCPSCYLNANTKKNSWFVEVCPKPHLLLWAKLKGFPYWPAKLMCANPNGMVDVRFFGAHDKAWVSFKECYLYSVKDPNSYKQKRYDIDECIKELHIYVSNLKKVFGEVRLAQFKTPFNPEKLGKHLVHMLPKYKASETEQYKIKIQKLHEKEWEKKLNESDEDEEEGEEDDENEEEEDEEEESDDEEEEENNEKENKVKESKDEEAVDKKTEEENKIEETVNVKKDDAPVPTNKETKTNKEPKEQVAERRTRSRGGLARSTGKLKTLPRRSSDTPSKRTSTDSTDSPNKQQRRNSEQLAKIEDDDLPLINVIKQRALARIVENEKPADVNMEKSDSKTDSIEHKDDGSTDKKSDSADEKSDSTDHKKDDANHKRGSTDDKKDSSSKKTESPVKVSNSLFKRLSGEGTENTEKPNSGKDCDKTGSNSAEIVKGIPKLAESEPKVDNKDVGEPASIDENIVNASDDDISGSALANIKIASVTTVLESPPNNITEKEAEPLFESPSITITKKRKAEETTAVNGDRESKVRLVSIENILNAKPVTESNGNSNSSRSSNASGSFELVKVKSEPESEEESDSEYLEKKHRYLSALNISAKSKEISKPLFKAKEIRTRSQREEKLKSKALENLAKVIDDVATHYSSKNAGKEIVIKKSERRKSFMKKDEPPGIQVKPFAKFTNVCKQRARKSFPMPNYKKQPQEVPTKKDIEILPKKDAKPVPALTAIETPTVNKTVPSLPPSSLLFLSKKSPEVVLLPQSPSTSNISTPIVSLTSQGNTSITSPVVSLQPPLKPAKINTPVPKPQPPQRTINKPIQTRASQFETLVVNSTPAPNPSVTTTIEPRSETPAQEPEPVTITTSSPSNRSNTDDELNVLNGLLPSSLSKAVTDLMCRGPPVLKPRPPGVLSENYEEGIPSSAGPVTAKINSIAHRMGDYFRGMLIETLTNLGQSDTSEATITNLKLEIENMKYKHEVEMAEIRKNMATVLGDIQKSVMEERTKAVEETRAKCEEEMARRVEFYKSRQWCANCFEEAQFYCCWNTSYCNYPCQQKHWPVHMSKCTQSMGQNPVAGPMRSHPLVLTPTNPPANKQMSVGRIITSKATKVYMNRVGTATKTVPNLKNGSHMTLLESTPGNYELVDHTGGSYTMSGKLIAPPGIMNKIKLGGLQVTTSSSNNTNHFIPLKPQKEK